MEGLSYDVKGRSEGRDKRSRACTRCGEMNPFCRNQLVCHDHRSHKGPPGAVAASGRPGLTAFIVACTCAVATRSFSVASVRKFSASSRASAYASRACEPLLPALSFPMPFS